MAFCRGWGATTSLSCRRCDFGTSTRLVSVGCSIVFFHVSTVIEASEAIKIECEKKHRLII